MDTIVADKLNKIEREISRNNITRWNVYKLKNIWLWIAVDRDSKELVGYELETREKNILHT